MPDPQALGRARARAHGLALWASFQENLPDLVRQFLAEDLPYLLDAAGTPDVAGLLDPDVGDELAAHQWVAGTVNLIRLSTDAIDHGTPQLWQARESDVREALGQPCPHHARLVLEVALRELAETGWAAEATADTNGAEP